MSDFKPLSGGKGAAREIDTMTATSDLIAHFRSCRAAGDSVSSASSWVNSWLNDLITENADAGLPTAHLIDLGAWWNCEADWATI